MPKGDPWPEITRVLAAEAAIRTGGSTAAAINTSMDPYWADLVRLLEVFAAKRRKDIAGIKAIGAEMSNQVYAKFIDRVIRKLVASR